LEPIKAHPQTYLSNTCGNSCFGAQRLQRERKIHKSACHPHKDENVDGTALLVAAHQLCKEE